MYQCAAQNLMQDFSLLGVFEQTPSIVPGVG